MLSRLVLSFILYSATSVVFAAPAVNNDPHSCNTNTCEHDGKSFTVGGRIVVNKMELVCMKANPVNLELSNDAAAVWIPASRLNEHYAKIPHR